MPEKIHKQRSILSKGREKWGTLFAACIQEVKTGGPIVVTQNGYPSAVLLCIEDYVRMKELAESVLDEESNEEK